MPMRLKVSLLDGVSIGADGALIDESHSLACLPGRARGGALRRRGQTRSWTWRWREGPL